MKKKTTPPRLLTVFGRPVASRVRLKGRGPFGAAPSLPSSRAFATCLVPPPATFIPRPFRRGASARSPGRPGWMSSIRARSGSVSGNGSREQALRQRTAGPPVGLPPGFQGISSPWYPLPPWLRHPVPATGRRPDPVQSGRYRGRTGCDTPSALALPGGHENGLRYAARDGRSASRRPSANSSRPSAGEVRSPGWIRAPSPSCARRSPGDFVDPRKLIAFTGLTPGRRSSRQMSACPHRLPEHCRVSEQPCPEGQAGTGPECACRERVSTGGTVSQKSHNRSGVRPCD